MINKRIALFCGSRKGKDLVYENEARKVGRYLVEHEIGMVFGGGSVGIMGILADEIMAGGGEVLGVIPKKIVEMEVAHHGITDLHIVDTMHQRKAMMADLADGFVALPGGIGTIEEIVEVFTWLQLGYHQKPCGLLNINGYFDPFIDFLDKMVEEDFLGNSTRAQLKISNQIEDLFSKMAFHP